MSTNLQIITDALRGLGVVGETDTPSAEQGSTALRALNQTMEQMEVVDGIRLGWFNQTSTADTIPVPSWTETAVAYVLGLRLAPIYGATLSPEFATVGASAYEGLLRTAINAKLQGLDMSHLGLGEGIRAAGFDITHG